MKTFNSSLANVESFDVSCQLRLHWSTCHCSTFEREKMGKHTGRETSRCVPSLAGDSRYFSQKTNTGCHRLRHCYYYWPMLHLNKKFHFFFGQSLGKSVELIWHWSKCLYGSLSSEGDFIDPPKSFSIIASVKCRNSSFRWVDIRGRNTAWAIYWSLK